MLIIYFCFLYRGWLRIQAKLWFWFLSYEYEATRQGFSWSCYYFLCEFQALSFYFWFCFMLLSFERDPGFIQMSLMDEFWLEIFKSLGGRVNWFSLNRGVASYKNLRSLVDVSFDWKGLSQVSFEPDLILFQQDCG